jgi:hypothetical protein
MFGGQFSDDGVQIRWLAPTITFIELGLELGGGNDFPASRGSGSLGSIAAWANRGSSILLTSRCRGSGVTKVSFSIPAARALSSGVRFI